MVRQNFEVVENSEQQVRELVLADLWQTKPPLFSHMGELDDWVRFSALDTLIKGTEAARRHGDAPKVKRGCAKLRCCAKGRGCAKNCGDPGTCCGAICQRVL